MRPAGARSLVVGGARRLGRQIALGLAADGAAVCIASRGRDAAAARVVDELEAAGAARATALTGDVGSPPGAVALVKAAAAALGGLDAVVFAASGPFVPQRPQELGEAGWDASFDVIAKGFFFTACAAHGAFLGGASPVGEDLVSVKGVVVAITDCMGLQPWAAFAAHGAAKAAQIHLVKELARAWAADGVRVCGVAPGPVDLEDDERRDATLRAATRTGGRHLVTPAQVYAGVRLCLENDGMTGTNLVVDGGALLSS